MGRRRTGGGRTNYTHHTSDTKKTAILVARPNPPFQWRSRHRRPTYLVNLGWAGGDEFSPWAGTAITIGLVTPTQSRRRPSRTKLCPRQATANLTRYFSFSRALLLLTRDPFMARGRAGGAGYPSSRLLDQARATSRLFSTTKITRRRNPGNFYKHGHSLERERGSDVAGVSNGV